LFDGMMLKYAPINKKIVELAVKNDSLALHQKN
jgi:hypothetical protein